MRDPAIVNQQKKMADVNIDWLAPNPAGDFLCNRDHNVLECSSRLTGSGKIYEQVFGYVKVDCPDAYFIITSSKAGTKKWIHYHQFLDNLYEYFVASDFVITQSGYGKVAELSAFGKPFIAIPLDYHFEQEYVMKKRLDHYAIGKLLPLRNHNPQSIAKIVKQLMNEKPASIKADTGAEVANIILNTIENNNLQ
jgi:hypothetical protein